MKNSNPPNTHVLEADGQRWQITIEETQTRVVISLESNPPDAVMTDATREVFLEPILAKFEGYSKPVMLGNPARGWAIVAGGQAILCGYKKSGG